MAKTERVEVRLDEALLGRLDEWIEQTGQSSSRSDAMRQLVELGLNTATGRSVQISDGEKLNFMLLRDLVKHLNVQTETDVDFIADTIYGGHYWAPTWEMQGLFHNHSDRPEDVSFVVAVLDAWTFIEEGLEKLSTEEREAIKASNYGHIPSFHGFDGNNESELMSIARFLVEKMQRFTRFKGRDFDSHAPKIESYRRLVQYFEVIRPTLGFGKSLNAEQIIALARA
ncbi:YfbU family protein [Comamonas thiooxydans]|uniref:YfbU family protein n=1 Tax=Comamonas thiooxydans TaxID=363952 RepID=A0AA42TQB2_9BURK|nr:MULTISPECIES: YfbU family protein [Comamonas]MDH1335822.1 YfbU family protein [Comamonas thiooxydans]MDH1743584.1 YfbU family protein [Comamonas thiooxydans]MDH1788523.1 YfbU family protein [Comamonas thiooxydans]